MAFLVKCFRCSAPYSELARALGLPDDDERKARPRRPPIRTQNAVEQALVGLLAEQAHRQHALRPWLDSLNGSAECHRERTAARELRQIATDLGDCDVAWDLLEEASQHEQRAQLLDLALDAMAARHNQTLRAFLAATA